MEKKRECALMHDLLPLYAEELLSAESEAFVREHLAVCEDCRTAWERLGEEPAQPQKFEKGAGTLRKIAKRWQLQTRLLAVGVMVFFMLFGFGLTDGVDPLYNSLIMPLVGVFGYVAFSWRAVYLQPLLLLLVNFGATLFGMVEFEVVEVLGWTLIYGIFMLVGVAIAFLAHFGLQKEKGVDTV